MLRNINLKKELDKTKSSQETRETLGLLDQAFNILLDDVCAEKEIQKCLQGEGVSGEDIDLQSLEPDKVFALSEIRKMCVKYRLRFLDADKFCPPIPYVAISKIRSLERHTNQKIRAFKVMAPSEVFELQDCDKDPVLFADLGNGKYYYIHHWGTDLSWWRPIVMFPFRSFKALALSIFSVSLLISTILPTDSVVTKVMVDESWARFAFFVWSFVCITAIVTYVGFAFFKNLSSAQWNSPFFKQSF